MDNYLKEKADLLLKSLYKNVNKLKQKKNAIEDVLDSNRMAEVNPDDVPTGSSGILNKAKKEEVKKNEEIAQKLLKNLETISKAYKSKMEKRCWEGYEPTPGKEAYSEGSCQPIKKEEKEKEKLDSKKIHKKEFSLKADHKSDKGGLTEKGRKAYNKATGSNLKRPQPEGGKRKKSFCARNKGQIDMHNIDCKKTPEKRACKARKRWKC
jgi:hypothetical protein